MEYWSKRILDEQNKITDKNIDATEAQLRKYYKQAMQQAIEEFENTYNALLAQTAAGQEPTVAKLYTMDKYYKMQAQIKQIAEELGDKEVALMSKQFEKQYEAIYNTIGARTDSAFGLANSADVDTAINTIWCSDGKHFSDRIWSNTGELVETLNDTLVSAVVTGKTQTQLKQELQKRFNVSHSNADCIARTEMARLQTQASLDRYKAHGRKQVRIVVDEDERTCPICAKKDDKLIDIVAARIGETIPPFHPRCRCCIAPVVEEGVKEVEYTERANGRRDYYIDKAVLTKEQLEGIMPLIKEGATDIDIYYCEKCKISFPARRIGHGARCPNCGNYCTYNSAITVMGQSISSLHYNKDTEKFSFTEETAVFTKRKEQEEKLAEKLAKQARILEEQQKTKRLADAKAMAAAKTKRGLTEDKPYISSALAAEKKEAMASGKELTYYGHTCEYCGRYFETKKRAAKTCPICKNKISEYGGGQEKRIVKCIKCGKGFIKGVGNNTSVCPDCQAELLGTKEATRLLKRGYTESGAVKVMTGQTKSLTYINPKYDTNKTNDTLFNANYNGSLLDLFIEQNTDVDKHAFDEYSDKDKNNKFFVCVDCGKVVFKGDNRNNNQKRCPECQAAYRKKYKAEKERERRKKKKK